MHEHPSNNQEALYVGFSPCSLLLWKGLTYLDLDRSKEALETFALVETLEMPMSIPERMRIEIINHQAEAAIGMRDLDLFHTYIEAGAIGANALGSEKRYQEAFDIYKQGRSVWPRETRVRALGDLFVR